MQEGGDKRVAKDALKLIIDEKLGIERSLKKFKRMCEAFGVVREYRKRQEYKRPSIRLKEKRMAAEKRREKNRLRFSRGSSI